MNNEKKKKLVDEACDLFNDAIEKVTKAKKMLKKCGIEFCNGIDEDASFCYVASNLHMSKGIDKFSDITEEKPYFLKDILNIRKIDRSRKYIKYKGLVFIQLANEIDHSDSFNYTFR